ncbi:MAG: DUF1254 domain-containing protein [Solirubrobacteraceae bacterium]
MATEPEEAPVVERVKLAAEAYTYGYPLVYSLRESVGFVAGTSRFPMQAPYNEFGHVRKLAGPELKFVSPNNDTCYSIAICDVRQGPLVLHVPDTADRYYVLQFIDAWTNNFAYIGRRATGTAEGEFLLAEHGYTGAVPDGMRVVHSPTGVFVIDSRVQVDNEADLPAVHALQDQLRLTPLSVHMGGSAPAPVAGVPRADPRVGEELEWWERFRVALRAFPPPAADAPFLKLCEQFGLTQVDSPYVEMDPAHAAVLIEGAKAGLTKIEELMKQIHATPEGWQSALHLFDYNLDYFEIGAIDAPEWKIADRARAYVTRAVVARAGLWGNHGYEANYGLVWVDGDGNQLDGSNRYELVLETPPPVDAFWSLTMYDVPDFYLVANPSERYSIGDRTPGLKTAADGSVTIYLQKDSPGPDKESNWLPTPPRAFRPIMRMYQPRKEILDGTYVLPAIRKGT